jgi:co-chaperonin GroES (HSP10)
MLQPLAKRIIVQPIIPEKKASVIIVKDDAPQTFTVIAIGDDVTRVDIGDTIFLAAYSTAEVKYNNEKYQIVLEDNVIAKVL